MAFELPPNFEELHRAEVARRATILRVSDGKQPAMAAAVMSPYANNYIGIDMAPVYQPNVDWAYLAQQKNFGFAAIKALEVQEGVSEDKWSHAGFAPHIQAMHDAGVPQIPYIFLNPLSAVIKWGYGVSLGAVKALKRTDNIEYTALQATLANKEYFAIMIDLERYWDNYSDYWAYLNHTITLDKVKVISPEWIAADLQLLIGHLIQGMKANELRQVPIIIYSGKWFIEGYMVSNRVNLFYEMADDLEKMAFMGADGLMKQQVHFWGAAYTNPTPNTWAEFLTMLPDGVTQKPYYGNFTRPLVDQVGVRKMPNGQYAATSFDLDVALWPKDQFDTALSIKRGVPPPPDPDHTCPDGQHWDDVQGKCVLNDAPPPPPGDWKAYIDAAKAELLAAINHPNWLK